MAAIRVQAVAETDGELHLRGLPIHRGETAEVIVLTPAADEPTDEALMRILTHDPARGTMCLSTSGIPTSVLELRQ